MNTGRARRRIGRGLRQATLLVLVFTAACSGETVYNTAIGWERWRAGAHAEVKRVGDADWPYLEGGPSDGPIVLLVHGFGIDKYAWLPLIKALGDRYHIVAPDLPGFGEARHDPALHYDVPSQAGRVHAFVHALGLEKIHIAGLSMGGAIAAEYALRYPEDLVTLTLLDAAGVKSPEPSEVARLIAGGDNPLIVDSVASFDRLLDLTCVKRTQGIPDSVKAYLVERAAKNRAFDQRVFDEVFHDFVTPPHDLTPELGRIKTPTLVLWCDTDRVIHPSAADVYANGIAGAEKVILVGCSHAPQFDRPADTAQAFAQFLAKYAGNRIH